MLRWMQLLCALCLGAWGQAAWSAPNYRALLVGVSEYPGLRSDLSLQGPRNDVQRMRQLLLSRGVPAQAITVLADGVEGAALPTRERILGALGRLAETARPGDYIVLLMAGHGSQSPVPAGSPYAQAEPDGKFEIFLPRDVQGWSAAGSDDGGEVRNAIYDHEIRAQVDRMTAAGAFVWGIFDACHSATLVRSGGMPGMQMRQVLPADLGVPDAALRRAEARAHGTRRTGNTEPRTAAAATSGGGSVFFYAAQTTEATPEMMMPPELPPTSPQARRHGLFTFTLIRALEGGGGMTYQQLAQQVLTRYGTIQGAYATPLFTGTALQSGVLGQSAVAVRQWNLIEQDKGLRMAGGLLADIQPDSVLAILPSAVAGDSEAIGHARVAASDMASATLVPTDYAGLPARSLAQLKAGRVARMVSPAVRFDLDVAVDLRGCATPCPFTQPLELLKKASDEGRAGVPGARVRWVDVSASVGLTLTARGRRLWFASHDELERLDGTTRARSLAAVEAAASASAAGLAEEIGHSMHAVSRARNLMRIAAALASSPASTELKVAMQTVSPAGQVVAVHPGDRLRPGPLRVSLQNMGRGAIDVSAFYLDSKYGITQVYPTEPGANNRLEAGASPLPFDIEITDETLGAERLIVIGVAARKHGERADYAFLAAPTLSHAVVTRGAAAEAQDDTARLLRDAGFADYATRGARPASPPSSTGMQMFSWQVVPE